MKNTTVVPATVAVAKNSDPTLLALSEARDWVQSVERRDLPWIAGVSTARTVARVGRIMFGIYLFAQSVRIAAVASVFIAAVVVTLAGAIRLLV